MSKRSNKRAMFAPQVLPPPTRLSRPTLELSSIRTDGGTQPRERLDQDTLAEYAERMMLDPDTGFVMDPEGQKWPELVVFFDGTDHWLADGFHRFSAASHADIESFQVRREEGTQRDAILHSLGVNATHGKRRTNADKRRAIERALLDEQWRQWSDARIASLCKVSSPMVSKLRSALESEDHIPFEPVLYSADGREFERVEPARARASQPKKAARAVAPSSKIKISRSFKKIEKIKDHSLDALIAYPNSQADWAALATHAERALSPEHGRLIVHLPSTGQLWDGPATLSANTSFVGSHICFVESHRRHYVIWSTQKSYAPGVAQKAANALLDTMHQNTLLLGTALDSW